MLTKKELAIKYFCEELFDKMLEGNIIKGETKKKKTQFKFLVKKEAITKEINEASFEKIYKKNVLGYHYTFSIAANPNIRFIANKEQIEKLEKELVNKDYICH